MPNKKINLANIPAGKNRSLKYSQVILSLISNKLKEK